MAGLRDHDPKVGVASRTGPGEDGRPRGVEPLIARLDDERREARREAAEALGALGDARAVEALAVTIGRFTPPSTRYSCSLPDRHQGLNEPAPNKRPLEHGENATFET